MSTYRVQHNFVTSQPAWRGDYVRRYGENNEGFTIEADDEQEAKEKLKTEHNLNPFYVKLTKVS